MIDIVFEFLDCFCQVLYDFLTWDWKVYTLTILLVGSLLGRTEGKTQTAS